MKTPDEFAELLSARAPYISIFKPNIPPNRRHNTRAMIQEYVRIYQPFLDLELLFYKDVFSPFLDYERIYNKYLEFYQKLIEETKRVKKPRYWSIDENYFCNHFKSVI